MQGIWLCNLLSHKSNLGPTKRKHEDILKLRGGRSGLSCGSQKWALVTLPQQNASARRPPTCITGKLRIDPRAVPQRIGMRRETDKGKAQAPTRSHMLASLRQSTLLAGLLQGPQHCSSLSTNSVFMVGLDGTVALNSRDEWRVGGGGVEELQGSWATRNFPQTHRDLRATTII